MTSTTVRIDADLSELAERALQAFTRVHREVFAGDAAANPRLPVEVIDASVVSGVPVLVVLTPWTLNGLVVTAGDFPAELVVAARPKPVYATELEPLGAYRSVNLVGDVSGYRNPESARTIGRSWVAPLHAAVRSALEGDPPA